MNLINLEEIGYLIKIHDIISSQKQAFIDFSGERYNIPPVGYIEHTNPNGSYHIKYGMKDNDKYLIIKIAGGPDDNEMNGMMIVTDIRSGAYKYILNDKGFLTQYRTAIVSTICVEALSLSNKPVIGILGSGSLARMHIKTI